jgi:hypothetical protein
LDDDKLYDDGASVIEVTKRKRAMVAAFVWLAVAGLSLAWVLSHDGTARAAASMVTYSQEEAAKTTMQKSSSCFWSKRVRRWCIDAYASTEYENDWSSDEWSITQYADDDRYYVYNHKDELDGYLRPTPWGWRAMVQACPTNPPKGWSRQGCGWVRAGKAVRVRNHYRVYRRGKVVGTARGPDAVGVAAYELVEGFDHEQYWKDGEGR